MVEERSKCVEAKDVSHGGELGSEYVGTSSTYPDESSGRRKPKVSRATRIVPGLVDPKASLLLWQGNRWKSRLIFLHLVEFVISFAPNSF